MSFSGSQTHSAGLGRKQCGPGCEAVWEWARFLEFLLVKQIFQPAQD